MNGFTRKMANLFTPDLDDPDLVLLTDSMFFKAMLRLVEDLKAYLTPSTLGKLRREAVTLEEMKDLEFRNDTLRFMFRFYVYPELAMPYSRGMNGLAELLAALEIVDKAFAEEIYMWLESEVMLTGFDDLAHPDLPEMIRGWAKEEGILLDENLVSRCSSLSDSYCRESLISATSHLMAREVFTIYENILPWYSLGNFLAFYSKFVLRQDHPLSSLSSYREGECWQCWDCDPYWQRAGQCKHFSKELTELSNSHTKHVWANDNGSLALPKIGYLEKMNFMDLPQEHEQEDVVGDICRDYLECRAFMEKSFLMADSVLYEREIPDYHWEEEAGEIVPEYYEDFYSEEFLSVSIITELDAKRLI